MKFLIPVFFMIFFFVGCERIEGLVTVSKDIKLKNSKGDIHLVRIGSYSADIKAKTSKKITLRLNNDSEEKFIFNHDGNIPDHGNFSIPSSLSGQPVNLFGSILKSVVKSDIKEATVSCSYQMPYQVCYPIPMGGMGCSVQYQVVYGYQWIRFYDVVTTKNIDLIIKAAENTEEAAHFQGDIVNNERIILNEGVCR